MSSAINSLKAPELTFKKALTWIGSSVALSWPTILATAVWPWLTGSLSGELPGYELAISIHVFDLLTGVIAAVVLVAFRYIRRANEPVKYRSSGAANLVILFIAGVSAVVGAVAIAASFGPTPASYFEGIPIGVIASLGQMMTFTIIIAITRELRGSVKLLAKKTHALNYLKVGLESRVAQQRDELREAVAGRIARDLSELQLEVSKLQTSDLQTESAKALANRIKEYIDQVVRPLSLEIANSPDASAKLEIRSLREIEKSIRRLPFRQRMRSRLSLGYVFNLPFTAIAFLVFLVTSYGYIFGPAGLLGVGIPGFILSLGFIWLARRVSTTIRASYLLAILTIPIGAAMAAIPFAVLNNFILGGKDTDVQQAFVVLAFVVCSFSFYASLFVEVSFLNVESARVVNRELRKLVAFLENESQVNRRTMAQLLHGKIQARLQAASLRLKQSDEVSNELLEAVVDDLQASRSETLKSAVVDQDLETQISEMANQWSGICDLTMDVSAAAAARANANPLMKSAVIEVIREALNNAIKHGEADEADGSVLQGENGDLLIHLRNAVYSEGVIKQSPKSGYGTQLLDQITDSWSVRFEDGDAIFEARIAAPQTNL